eukprot:GEMP01101555.1.p3 GENE.GEMP01101555.1~~GEMP01101555.1.p3  ORF type:complete len:122 (+),score=23.31 GEMP01101555.1:379-744(+)
MIFWYSKPEKGERQFSIRSDEVLATQTAELFHWPNCKGDSHTFDTSGNAAMAGFQPFVRKTQSVKLCGKGTFFYFNTPDMQELATLGHVSRCHKGAMEGCTCETLPKDTWNLVESFTLQYC